MTDAPILPDLAAFLTRYQAFTAQHATQHFQAFAVGFGHLRATLQDLQVRRQTVERQHAPRFNLFRLLGVTTKEVKTHSALLADLLDPRGMHGQGILFLAAFLRYCQQKFPLFPIPQGSLDSALWTVTSEKTTSYGKPDLVVAAPECQVLLVIENKIGAGEQPDQLDRYSQWLQQQSLYPPAGRALLYLTPDGREASTAGEVPYHRLSYREDIAAWLRDTLNEIGASQVHETLLQYLDVIVAL
jgi:hypothetical protein